MSEQSTHNKTENTEPKQHYYLNFVQGTPAEEEEAHKKNVLSMKLKQARSIAITVTVLAIGITAIATDIIFGGGAVSASVATGVALSHSAGLAAGAGYMSAAAAGVFAGGFLSIVTSITALAATGLSILSLKDTRTKIANSTKSLEARKEQIQKDNPNLEAYKGEGEGEAKGRKEHIGQLRRQQDIENQVSRQIDKYLSTHKKSYTHLTPEDIENVKQKSIKQISEASKNQKDKLINYIKGGKGISRKQMKKIVSNLIPFDDLSSISKINEKQKKQQMSPKTEPVKKEEQHLDPERMPTVLDEANILKKKIHRSMSVSDALQQPAKQNNRRNSVPPSFP